MRRSLRCLGLFTLFVLLQVGLVPSVAAQTEQAGSRPNVVILFADDLGYGDLSSYGHPTIRTPHLDGMARDGIRMTSFYSVAPSCTPARAALLTGRYPVRSGLSRVIMPASENGIPASEITLAEALQDQGYRTMAVGKWHLGHQEEHFPTKHGFDHYFGLIYSNDMIPPWVQTDRPLELYRDMEPVEHPVVQSTLTQRFTEEAVRFIASADEEPFFLYLAYSMPHLPIYASEQFQGTSRGGRYGDVIEEIDASVGRVLATLQEQNLAENTIVVFTSDNGPWLNPGERMLQGGVEPWDVGSPGPLRGSKGTTYEGGVRVPAILRWPGHIPPGQVSAEMATVMDLYPTFLRAAGGALPEDRVVDGQDIMPLLEGQVSTSPTQQFYYFSGERLHAVREGPWKFRLAEAPGPGEAAVPELFHLDIDPGEHHNVVDRYPEVAARLKAQMQRFAREIARARP